MAELEDLKPNASVGGVLPSGLVTVVNVQWFGQSAIELTYKVESTGAVGNRLLYRGDAIDAATAADWGLVEKVVPPAELDAAIEETVATIAANGPAGIRLQKKLMRDWEQLGIEDGIRAGVEALASAFEIGAPGKRIKAYFDAKG